MIGLPNLVNKSGAELGLDTALMSKFLAYLNKADFIDFTTEEFRMYNGPYMEDENLHESGLVNQNNSVTAILWLLEPLVHEGSRSVDAKV